MCSYNDIDALITEGVEGRSGLGGVCCYGDINALVTEEVDQEECVVMVTLMPW